MIEAPFDMPGDIPDLIGMRADVGDSEIEIRGVVSKMPPEQIRRGEALPLLVVRHKKGPATQADHGHTDLDAVLRVAHLLPEFSPGA